MKKWILFLLMGVMQSAFAPVLAKRAVLTDGQHYVWVKIAYTPQARARGLMFRSYLLPFQGMLFVFEENAPVSFWMRNTMIPLHMRFYDEAGQLVHQVARATPCYALPCASYPSERPVRYVLETRAHRAYFDEHDWQSWRLLIDRPTTQGKR